jgi:hypothetical protein
MHGMNGLQMMSTFLSKLCSDARERTLIHMIMYICGGAYLSIHQETDKSMTHKKFSVFNFDRLGILQFGREKVAV